MFADLGVEDVTLVGISKGPDRDAGREHFYMPGREPFRLDPKSPVLYYLQRLRDEAHRFAIGSHRKKRSKAIGANPLDEVAGVGAGAQARAAAAFRLGPGGGGRQPRRSGGRGGRQRDAGARKFSTSSTPAAKARGVLRCAPCSSLPNLLTMFRILLVPVFALAFVLPGDAGGWSPSASSALPGFSDALDGLAARKLNACSDFGRMLDPIADKVLVAVALMMLVAEGIRAFVLMPDVSLLRLVPALVILAREILVSGLREFLAGAAVSVPVTAIAKIQDHDPDGRHRRDDPGARGRSRPVRGAGVAYSAIAYAALWIAAALTVYTG